jgi:hypothetical protein
MKSARNICVAGFFVRWQWMPACAGMTGFKGPAPASGIAAQAVSPAQAGVHDGARAAAKAHPKIRSTDTKLIKPLLVIFCDMLTFGAV